MRPYRACLPALAGKLVSLLVEEVQATGCRLRVADEEGRVQWQQTWGNIQRSAFEQETAGHVLRREQPFVLEPSVLCFPFQNGFSGRGALYIERSLTDRPFSEKDSHLAHLFSKLLAHILCTNGQNQAHEGGGPDPLEDRIIGRSESVRRIRSLISMVAAQDVPVLIRGESGTGKELVARSIHESGRRKSGRYVAVNCGAIPETLLESELFGHSRGAFTGAWRERAGLVEDADGGTFFLDEVGDLSPHLQSRLLRLLQENEFRRVGENRLRRANVRFLAATHRNLEDEIQKGRFREDLYYRLAVVTVDIPPLRNRKEDLPQLLDHFLDRGCRELNRHRPLFTPAAQKCLQGYDWPGNVRELHNEILRCLVLAPAGLFIDEESLSRRIRRSQGGGIPPEPVHYHAARAHFEKHFLQQALSRHHFNKTKTAEAVGLSRQGLFRLLRQHKI